MKKLMVCMTGAIALCLAGCSGAPSVSDFEAKLREYNKKIETPMPDELVKSTVEIYKEASKENRLKMFADLSEKAKSIKK